MCYRRTALLWPPQHNAHRRSMAVGRCSTCSLCCTAGSAAPRAPARRNRSWSWCCGCAGLLGRRQTSLTRCVWVGRERYPLLPGHAPSHHPTHPSLPRAARSGEPALPPPWRSGLGAARTLFRPHLVSLSACLYWLFAPLFFSQSGHNALRHFLRRGLPHENGDWKPLPMVQALLALGASARHKRTVRSASLLPLLFRPRCCC